VSRFLVWWFRCGVFILFGFLCGIGGDGVRVPGNEDEIEVLSSLYYKSYDFILPILTA
jgi:hypothetical protein